MRWHEAGIITQRQRPEVPYPGYALLLQAGYAVARGSGLHDWGPLGVRLLQRVRGLIDTIVREAGGGGVTLMACTTVRPVDESPPITDHRTASRHAAWYTPALLAFAATHPPLQPPVVREFVTCQPVYREEERPRGLFRPRTFTLYEAVAVAADAGDAARAQERWLTVWRRLLTTLGIPAFEAETEDASGTLAVSFVWPHETADTHFLHCPRCDTWYQAEVAPFRRDPPPFETPQPLVEVETPDCTTIEALCRYLGIPAWRAAKTMFLVAEGTGSFPLMVVVPGDREVSLAKVRRVVGPVRLRSASPEEVRDLGAEPGYGSPIGLSRGLVLVDITVANTPNLVAGANKAGYHARNVNVGRDIHPHVIADLSAGKEGDRCPACGEAYEVRTAWKLASVTYPFQRQSRTLAPTPDFVEGLDKVGAPLPEPAARDAEGKGVSPWFVRAALGLERLVGVLAETYHDEHGLVWPREVAPFDVHMVTILPRGEQDAGRVVQVSRQVYEQLRQAGLSVLLDDRQASAGVKFADADLIGCPFRITVSPRTLSQGAVEVKVRDGGAQLVPVEGVVETLL